MSFFFLLCCAYLDAQLQSEMQRVLARANRKNGKTYWIDIQQIAVRFSVYIVNSHLVNWQIEWNVVVFAFGMEEWTER